MCVCRFALLDVGFCRVRAFAERVGKLAADRPASRRRVGDQDVLGSSGYSWSLLPEVLPLREYVRETPTTPTDEQAFDLFGIQVEDVVDRFVGQDVWGVEVLNVRPSSPGALAGLQSRRAGLHNFLETLTFAGMLAFPPIGVGYMLISDGAIGDWHDLIIGVDGARVHDVSELESALERAKEGDIVYLSVLRAGKRLQIPVSLETAGRK